MNETFCSAKPVALCLMEPRMFTELFSDDERMRLERVFDLFSPPLAPADYVRLGPRFETVEVLVSTWGLPRMNEAFLARFPALRVLFYAAGSVREKATPASWARPVRVITAAAANAIPVAEFTFAQIVLGLKQVWSAVELGRRERRFVRSARAPAGTFRSTVALLGLGHIGRLVAERLRTTSLNVIAYDPLVSMADARDLGVTLCSLDDAFLKADLVSCHLPLLPETVNMIGARHLSAMKPHAVFLNTARGGVVVEDELLAVLHARPDLTAVLDVLQNECPGATSPLYALPNAVITPHIAGSIGPEWRRLGLTIVEEAERLVTGRALCHELMPDRAELSA